MDNSIEYQIFIGCTDSQEGREIISKSELRSMIVSYFERRKIDFTMLDCQGGYLHGGGWYITESSVCINIVGTPAVDMIKLAKSLSDYMNQESVLIVRNAADIKFV